MAFPKKKKMAFDGSFKGKKIIYFFSTANIHLFRPQGAVYLACTDIKIMNQVKFYSLDL